MNSKTQPHSTCRHKSWPLSFGIVAAVVALVPSLMAQQKLPAAIEEDFHPTRVIAKFKSREQPGPQQAILKQHGLRFYKQYKLLPQVLALDLADEAQAKAAAARPPQARARELQNRIAELRGTGRFDYVEPDFVRKLNVAPTDAYYTNGSLWALQNTGQNGGAPGADMGATPAWDITTGSTNVIIAVIDTGIRYTHQELAAQIWRNPGEIPGNGIDDDGDGYIDNLHGINATVDPKGNPAAGNPFDDNGHGTHVAGTIGAAANDAHPHVGVAWNVRLMACKSLNSNGNGYVSDEVECIAFATAKGARIINASYGDGSFSQTETDAIQAAGEMGVLFVAAAGNAAADNDTHPVYPASCQLGNIVSVAALDRFDRVARFSNVGANTVHLGAPGAEILSCFGRSDSEYLTLDGTSMAAPHVCGAAALVLAAHPDATLEELRQRLLAGTVPIRSLQGFAASGGRLNAANALTVAADGVLEISVSPPVTTPLRANSGVPISVSVSDLFEVTNAVVTAVVEGVTNLIFRNDGVSPDARPNDGTYTTLLEVPAGADTLRLRISIASPGRGAHTHIATYAVLPRPDNDDFAHAAVLQGTNPAAT